MKALSLKQPFAELIIQGRKKIELRKWNTKFRGEFLIHASKKPDEDAMKKFGFENLSCGVIIGKVNLIDVKKYEDKKEHEKDRNLHLASDFWGNYGFILKDAQRIHEIPCKGNLGFWNFHGELK